MKAIMNFFFLCLLATQIVACKKDVTKPTNSIPATASNIAGTFTVSSFESAGDQTSLLSGYTFEFKENGVIVATKGNEIFNGTWRFDDSNSTEIKISFSDAPLNQLNKSWHITDLTDDRMFLTDDSNSEDEYDDNSSDKSSLEFERD